MTPRDSETVLQRALAFKAYEIEELADVYFFRPLGALIAHAAKALRLTPTLLTVVGSCIGIAGGALLYDERLGLIAFALLIVFGIFDSADGQLARLTSQSSDLGRVLDGVGGYLTHAAMYIAIVLGSLARGGSWAILLWVPPAALANVLQAQLYDYYRTAYAVIVLRGVIPSPQLDVRWGGRIVRLYQEMQRRLLGRHVEVEDAVVSRAVGGRVRDEDRARYRRCFYWPVRGWNVMGDNTRFYAIGVLAWFRHVDWFLVFVTVPMSFVLVALWFWQARADRRFLNAPVIG